MCWFVVIKWFVGSLKYTTILTLLVCYDIILQFMQCKMLQFVCLFLRFHIQMTIYCCVTKT